MYVFENRTVEYPSSGVGDYSLELVDSDGQVIMDVRFDLGFRITSDSGWMDLDFDGFAFNLPYPDTMETQLAKIQLKHNDIVLAERILSANSPTVDVLYPNGGEQLEIDSSHAITWSAHDLDGDTLSYCVLFSDDSGENWTALTVDIPDTEFIWETSYLNPGDSYTVRIIATDGINTAIDESDSVFEVTGIPAIFGDANRDGVIDVGDVVYLINYLFTGTSAPDPLWVGDCNCDGVVDIGDVVYLINYLFTGTSPPGC